MQQESLPGPETKINIYAGTGENADLSNFAERPLNFGKVTGYSLPEGSNIGAFTSKYPIYNIGKTTYSTKQNPESGESFVFEGLSDLFSGRRFKTVEGAFQAAKLVFTHPKGNGVKGNKYWQSKEYTQRENSMDGVYYNTASILVLTNEGEQLLQKLQEASGAQAKSLGRQIEGLDRQAWDANSSKIMKALIGRSFEDNPQALQRLLATGNATLTHTQDKSKWGTEFPRLLMEVRDELRNSYASLNTNQTPVSGSTTVTQQAPKIEIFNGFWTRQQVAQQQDKVFLFGDNTNDRVNTNYIPTSTQAVIRGLPNAIGIDTKKDRGVTPQSYFTDADFNQFKAQVDAAIAQAKASGKTIVIPADGIGTGKAMLKEKAPKCFKYLQQELQKLQNIQRTE
ncbi:MAG: NADAR family protein [Bacteroidales bacterium]|nr:NADAR family protein [Bacteroidales bacterium]